MEKLTAARVRELFYYDPLKGHLNWRATQGNVPGGRFAGTWRRHRDGRVHMVTWSVGIDGAVYPLGRVCFLHYWGFLPKGKYIKFKNANSEDFRIENLCYSGFDSSDFL